VVKKKEKKQSVKKAKPFRGLQKKKRPPRRLGPDVERIKEKGPANEKVAWKPGNMLYPLPVVLVSCGDLEEEYNLFTVAWTGILSTNPPFCYISVRPGRHSFEMIKERKEFAINLTNKALARATDWCGVRSGKNLDKFAEMNLTPAPGIEIKAPVVAESPVNLECVVREIKEMGSHVVFLAEIVKIQANKEYIDEKTGALNLEKAHLIAFSHGKYYELGKRLGNFGYSVEKKKTKKKRRAGGG
jgi:flavin reductase (DIM6/NTAB) family NADH-FMN oxidoreductase RutF